MGCGQVPAPAVRLFMKSCRRVSLFPASSLLNGMDQSADPCEDFFQFACGAWNKRHQIPEDRSSVSTFEVLSDELQIILKDLLEEPPNPYDNSATIKAKTLYHSCMKLNVIEDIGDRPLRIVLKRLGGWPVTQRNWTAPTWTLERLLGILRGDFDQGVIVEQWVGPDDKNSSVNIIQMDQQLAFGLPSREYYLKEGSEKDRRAYHRLMVEVALLLGAEPEEADAQMEQVLQLETRLANISVPEADRHDTGSIYNKMTLRELSDMVPQFNWTEYMSTFLPVDVTGDEPVVVYSVPYLQQIGQILQEPDRRTLHNFAVWRLVNYLLTYLDGEYAHKRNDFRKVMLGVSADKVRWHHCVELANKKMGMAVGALFIKDNFDPHSKETYQDNRADAVVSLPILSGRELAALSSKKPSRDESCHSPGGHRVSQVKLSSSRTRQRARDLSFLGFVTLLGAVCCVLGYLAFLRPQRTTPVAITESAAKICLTPECVKTERKIR
ncbi:putative neprilysin [Ixodes scapularis]